MGSRRTLTRQVQGIHGKGRVGTITSRNTLNGDTLEDIKMVNKCQGIGNVNIMQIDNHNIKSIIVSKEVAGRCFRKC